MCNTNRIYLLPIIVFLWFVISVSITFFIAVELKHIPMIFPYISDTGTFPPESCIFGELLNIGVILLGIGIYIKYIQVKALSKQEEIFDEIKHLNNCSLFLGLVACLGLSIVANFQETIQLVSHLIGAILAFHIGYIYMIVNTIIYVKLLPNNGTESMKNLKIMLSITSLVCCNIWFVTFFISMSKFNGSDTTKWKESEGGYEYHLISTISEWIAAISILCYVLTYTKDFKYLEIQEPIVINNKPLN